MCVFLTFWRCLIWAGYPFSFLLVFTILVHINGGGFSLFSRFFFFLLFPKVQRRGKSLYPDPQKKHFPFWALKLEILATKFVSITNCMTVRDLWWDTFFFLSTTLRDIYLFWDKLEIFPSSFCLCFFRRVYFLGYKRSCNHCFASNGICTLSACTSFCEFIVHSFTSHLDTWRGEIIFLIGGLIFVYSSWWMDGSTFFIERRERFLRMDLELEWKWMMNDGTPPKMMMSWDEDGKEKEYIHWEASR